MYSKIGRMKNLYLLFVIFFVSYPEMCFAQSLVQIAAGTGVSGFSGDGGPATAARFGSTQGICYDHISHNLYIYDVGNCRVRKINSAGIVSTVAGNGSGGYSGDGGAATAASINGYGLSCDHAGNLYIGDWNNNRVRKVDMSTGIITTVAGTGVGGSSGDGGAATAADIRRPIYACTDIANNIYISEYGSSKIRKVDAITGIISTVASGVGSPVQLAIDGAGNIFIADQGGRIRKVSPSGVVSTYAGGGSGAASGVPATATSLRGPEGVTIDCSGNVIIADNDNNLIRKVDATTGIITTIAGGGLIAVTVAGVPATSARFHNQLICFDETGNLYCTDDSAPTAYRITNVGSGVSAIGGVLNVCPGGTSTLINSASGGTWSSSNILVATVGSSSGILTGVSGGTATISYSVGSCLAIAVVTVSAMPAITGASVICLGTPVVLSSAMPGGTWSSSNPMVAVVGSSTGVVTGMSVGTATITYMLTTGCFVTSLVSIVAFPGIGAIIGPSALCIGQTITLSNATSSGVWSSSNAARAIVGSSSGIVTGISAGTVTISYTVTYTCGSATATKAITVNPSPAPITGDSIICGGGTITLANAVAGGVWSSGTTSVAIVDAGGIVTSISPGIALISYTMPGGCYTSRPVTVYPLPDAGFIMDDNINSFCVGETMHIWDTTSGGVWSIANSNATLSGSTLTAVSAGDDTVMYIVSNLCGSDTAFFYFTVSGIPPVPYGNRPLCIGDTIALRDSVGGGMWSGGWPIVYLYTLFIDSAAVVGKSAGVATLTYALDLGCSVTFTVTVNPAPDAGTITGQPALCVDASTTLENTATGGIWSSTDTGVATIDQNGHVTARDTGITYIIYKMPPNSYGCTASDTLLFSVITPHYNINSNVAEVKCNGVRDGSIEMQKLGANIICSYQWSTGATTSKIDSLPAGVYIVTVTVINTQCKVVDTFRINEPDILSAGFAVTMDLCRTHTGSIAATISGGVGPYKYLWSNNATGAEAKNLASGSYNLTTTDANNCSKSYTVVVGDSCVAVVIRNALSPNGDGANDTWIIEGIEAFPGNKVQVFDKWGDLVYEKDGYRNDWAGTGKSGSLLPDGTFYYLVKLNAPYSLADKDVYTGHLMIKR